jgi:hypothetical protein
MSTPRRTRDWLARAATEAPALAVGRQLVGLQQALDAALPEALHGRAVVGGFADGTLVVLVAGGAAAGRLRHALRSVEATLAQARPEVRRIEISVSAGLSRTASAARTKRAQLGPEAVEPLQRLAAALPDSPLRDSVARLARKARFRE